MTCAICAGVCRCGRASATSPSSSLALGKQSVAEGGEWRREVATRVTRYRARRGRYGAPSLSLNFDAAPPVEFATPPADSNLIEFPRTVAPMEIPQGLAEPVVSPPRIFEAEAEAESPEPPREPQLSARHIQQTAESDYADAPDLLHDLMPEEVAEASEVAEESPLAASSDEVAVPSMAYDSIDAGIGMILEEVLPLEDETSSEPAKLVLPVSFASPSLRALAGLVDSAMVLTGVALFIVLLDKMNSLPVGSPGLVVAVGVFILLWTLYQYLFLVYRGSTAGLGAAKLTLATMQGNAAPTSARRTRALCMLLSCASVGLGFAWAFLDEDGLCWHDRISQTCLIIANFDEQDPR